MQSAQKNTQPVHSQDDVRALAEIRFRAAMYEAKLLAKHFGFSLRDEFGRPPLERPKVASSVKPLQHTKS